jgi:sorbose reductase
VSVNVEGLFELHGKNALVTGASSGIGKQVALAYAQAGAAVAIAGRRREPLETVAAEIVASGGRAVAITCDVTRPELVSAMLNRADEELGGIDIAVCNAGIIAFESLMDMSLEEFLHIQNTNVNGVFLTAQAAAKAMLARQRAGTIITTASMSGHIVNTPQQVGHYCASKAAVIHLTKAMAVEFAPHNIRVNSVSPGYIRTELVEPYAEYHALWEPKIPLGRLGRPEELVGIYLFLASDASSYMTGSDIVIDGGYTCW